MNLSLIVAFMAALFLFLVVWLPARRVPQLERRQAGAPGSVELAHPSGRAAIGIFGVLAPLATVPRIIGDFRAGDLTEALGGLGMAIFFSCGGAFIWAYARRKVVLDQRGVRIVGFGAREVGWDELKDIKAVDHGALKDIQFVPKRGRRIVLDSTMPGWEELEQRLLELASGSAKPLAQAAMLELKRWRTQ